MRRAAALFCCVVYLLSGLVFTSDGETHLSDTTYAYPQPEVLEIDLVIHPSCYLQMIRSAEKKKYDAVVSINGAPAQKIGVQVRGAGSLTEGQEAANKRIPMELCFDHADPSGTFRGNTSLKLINCISPARLFTQLVAMQAYAFLGIPTPQTTPAFLRINGVDYGLYLAVEDLNASFVHNHFGNVSLYRPILFGDKSIPRDPDLTFGLAQLYAKVDHGNETMYLYHHTQDTRQYLDVDEILRFFACEVFCDAYDGYYNGYKNFYLLDNHGKLTLLPWDRDDVFVQFPNARNLQQYEEKETHSLLQDQKNHAAYRNYIRRLNDEFLDPDRFLPWLESMIETVSPFLRRDSAVSANADRIIDSLTTGNALFNAMSGNLLLTFRTLHDQLDAQLNGTIEACYVPEGMCIDDYSDSYREATLLRYDDNSVIFRVCSGFWRARRQAFVEMYGVQTIVIGAVFAAVFVLTVLSVYIPRRTKPRGKRREKGGTP